MTRRPCFLRVGSGRCDTRNTKEQTVKNTVWKGLASLAAVGAAWLAREAATALWSKLSDVEGPVNPADRSVTWVSALGWGVLAGVAAGMSRVLGRRGAAAAWERALGETPPGVQAA